MSLLALVGRKARGAKSTALLITLGLFGTALLLADGMITPSISVLGAVEGLSMISPKLNPLIIPFSAVILIALFLVQRRGTATMGRWFAPVIITWFVVIGSLGAWAIKDNPVVLTALNPHHAVQFFFNHGPHGLLILASVVLAVTGAEALYADIGHFGKNPIRIAWFALAMPALVLNYFGQGAALMGHGAVALENPFFFLAPKGFLIPLILLSTAAAVIASQALITGAFSLVQQGIQLGYIPNMRVIHTSKDMRGQIYIPLVNTSLMLACLFLVFTFKSSGNLASAYGISVMGTMLCTSILYLVYLRGRGVALAGVVALGVLFISLDLSFLLTNLSKIFSGGWFPLAVALVFFAVMQTWKWGGETLASLLQSTPSLLENLIKGLVRKDMPIARVPGTGFFLLERTQSRLTVLWHHLKHNKALHERVILLTVRTSSRPHLKDDERLALKIHPEGFLEVHWSHGYMESPDIQEICKALAGQEHMVDPRQTTFYLCRVNLRLKPDPVIRYARKKFFSIIHQNAASTVEALQVPPSRVVVVGSLLEI